MFHLLVVIAKLNLRFVKIIEDALLAFEVLLCERDDVFPSEPQYFVRFLPYCLLFLIHDLEFIVLI